MAIVIDGMSQAVLMATPHDLRDFRAGFRADRGLIATPPMSRTTRKPRSRPAVFPRARRGCGCVSGAVLPVFTERRRSMVGPVGCGLCGVDSIAAALPQVVPVASDWTMPPGDVGLRAMDALAEGNAPAPRDPAIHGAAFWDGACAITREDVGRHNALDKLAGALAATA